MNRSESEHGPESEFCEFGLVETIALKVVRTGSDKINFKILDMTMMGADRGTKIEDIIKETGLTKVPINVRINQLEKVGLIKRWRGTGLVMLTELGRIFMEMERRGEDMVRDRLMEMLNSISDHN